MAVVVLVTISKRWANPLLATRSGHILIRSGEEAELILLRAQHRTGHVAGIRRLLTSSAPQ